MEKNTFLKMKFETIHEVENFILLLNLGILVALKHQLIPIDMAEAILYNPLIKKVLKQIGVNNEIAEFLIHEGWELDAIKALDKDLYIQTIDNKIEYIFNFFKRE